MSSAPYLEVYAGLWGYNALLTAGGVAYFLQVTPAAVLAAAVVATLAALVQAASGHIFGAVRTYMHWYFCRSLLELLSILLVSSLQLLLLLPTKTATNENNNTAFHCILQLLHTFQ